MIRIPLKVKANLLTQEELVTIASGSSNSIKVKFDIDPNSDFADNTLTKRAIFRYYQGSYFISDVDANGEVYVPKFVIAYPYFKVALRAESENAIVVVTTNEIQVPVEKSPVFYETTITDGDVTIRNLDGALNIYKAGDVTFIDFTASYKTAVDAVIAGTYATTSALNLVASDVDSIKEDIINMSNSISDLQDDIADLDTTKADKADTYNKTETEALLAGKQDTLVSGENIKTINGTSLLGSGNYDFDTTLNEVSTNAVQNKVISKEVKELNYELAVLREAVFEVVLSEIDYTSVFTDSFAIPDTLTDTDGTHRVVFNETELKKVAGNSVVANQLVQNGNFESTSGWLKSSPTISFTVSNNIGTASGIASQFATIYRDAKAIKGHKYFVSAKIKAPSPRVQLLADQKSDGGTVYNRKNSSGTNTLTQVSMIITITADNSVIRVGFFDTRASDWTDVSIADVFLADLTQTFDAGNEPTSTDDVRIQWLIKYLENNPDYDAGTIKSSIINGLQSLDSNNEVIGTIAIPPTEIKSAGTAQDYIEVVEGDIVEGEQLYNLVIVSNLDEYTFVGNELWTKGSSQTLGGMTRYYLNKFIGMKKGTALNGICNKFINVRDYFNSTRQESVFFDYANEYFQYLTPTEKTQEELHAIFNSSCQIVFPLATPTQTTIATNLTFEQVTLLIQENAKINVDYLDVPPNVQTKFVVKKAISE